MFLNIKIILSLNLGILFNIAFDFISASYDDLETLMGHHYDFEFWKDPT